MTIRRHLLVALCVTVAILLAYFQTFTFDFVAFDDDILVYENPLVWEISPQTFLGAFTTYDPELYIPLTILSYQVDYFLQSGSAHLFHITNVILHCMNTLLVYAFFYVLSKKNIWITLCCTFIFALHPLNTEAVVWVSSRKDLLSTLFYLSMLLTYILYVRKGNKSLFIACIIFALLGFLSKIMLITAPVALVLLDVHERRPFNKNALIEKIPFIALSILFGLVALYGKRHMIDTTPHSLKLLMGFKSSAFYFQKLLVPTGLSVVYPFGDIPRWTSPAFIIPILTVFAIIGTATSLFKRHRPAFFGVAFFFLTVSPTFLNFAKAGEIFVASDRYVYLPALGLFYASFYLCYQLVKTKSLYINTASIVMALGVTTLGFMAHAQASYWQNNQAFFEHSLKFYPDSYVAQTNYGNALLIEGKYEEAINAYNSALAINDESAKTYSNLALAYARKGNIQQAINVLAAGFSMYPNSAELFIRLGDVYIMDNKRVEALEFYKKAEQLDPLLIQKKYQAIKGLDAF